jgi:hypothetical protein
MNVAIWGPNLPSSSEAMHVHAPGCADTSRGVYRQAGRPWTIDADTLRDLVLAVYPPEDFGYDADTEWLDYSGDIRVFPCVALDAAGR